ncbi:SDR family NAD(P)-dependent oxidoreductase [Elongatibacter sediminis]|uniref:SDR family NAD(P)-dependent oxidoreductase n=1 Tax=Elongatibacter sediminis TaxID=3119006 RepID=A0AAW9RIC1_9GAMM
MDLKEKVAVVTGGASGLGKATVQVLHDAGARVAIFDMNEQEGAALAEKLGSGVISCGVNIADDDSIAAGIASVVDAWGAVHVGVNCAGRGGGATKTLGRKGRFPMPLFRDVININLIGTFSVVSQLAEVMANNDPDPSGERGVIINAASIAAYEGQRGQVAYAASKGGMISLTLPIARDLAYYGIRMMSVAPGVFDTPILKGITPELKQSLAKDIPFPPRLGDPPEFAELVRHIAENPYLNGETIRLDGALRMT